MDESNKAKVLLERYIAGLCTEEEKAWLETWYLQNQPDGADLYTSERLADMRTVRQLLQKEITNRPIRKLWPRIAAAASVILAISAGGYFLLHKPANQQIAQNQKQDLLPGGNKAILIANGKKIILTGAKNGQLAAFNQTIISKAQDGQVVYHANDSKLSSPGVAVYDTLTIPRGGTYQLILSDGSKVWLNAATTLRYPEKFTGKERKVELISGEAYFAVVHNEKMPFRVIAGNETVEDVGTEFNINAYPDEPSLKTTLVAGSVRLSKGAQTVLLIQGQQAHIKNGDTGQNLLVTANANIEAATAWKNGLFHFDHANLKDVMRQISRWYDVDVVYADQIPHTVIDGEMYRNLKASQIFEALNYLKVDFRIEGKKIIVTNK